MTGSLYDYKGRTLRPESLKSFRMTDDRVLFISEFLSRENWKGGDDDDALPLNRKVCRFEISLTVKDEILVDASTSDAYLCWRFIDKEFMDKLSPSLVENIQSQLPLIMRSRPEMWHLTYFETEMSSDESD